MYRERKGLTVTDCSKVQLDRRKIVLAVKVIRLEQLDQRGCGISITGYFQNSSGWGPQQPEVRSAVRKELDQMTSKGP